MQRKGRNVVEGAELQAGSRWPSNLPPFCFHFSVGQPISQSIILKSSISLKSHGASFSFGDGGKR